jgi:glycosyltransferase involved in cell wall biosynthesis
MSREKTMYHIGTLDSGHALKNIAPIAAAAGIAFVHKNPWQTSLSYAENIRLMKASYTCPDYRNYAGIDSERVGYIPCRVFKAISYGQSGITNSVHAKALLGKHAEYVDSLEEIFRVTEARKDDVAWRQAAMRHVASRHTFIHRLRDLASVLNKRRTVVVISEFGWAVDNVHRGIEKALGPTYKFKYHNAKLFLNRDFLKDFQESDICLTSMNFYNDMMRLFTDATDRKKIAIVGHRDSDCWGMPAASTVCSDFTYSVTSPLLSDKFRERLGQPMLVTPNGVDPGLFPLKERDGVIKTIGWCGAERLKVKRIEMAKAIAVACGYELKIATAVPRHEMLAWYNSIDLLLVTSGPQVIDETGPLSAFEAIAAGVPVIGSSCGNFSFVPGPKFATIEEGTTILMSLLADPQQIKQIAAEQRSVVLKDWTYAAHVPAWQSLFDAVREKKSTKESPIAVTFYGGFRSFELNLRRNIEELLGEVKGPVHFYILTEYCDDYERKKQQIIDIIQSYKYEIKYFEHVGESAHYNADEELAFYKDYYAIPYDGVRNDFTPKLFYRRCLINKIMNGFKIEYKKIVCARLFDIIIKRFRSLDFINNPHDETLYFSVDTILIGKMETLNKFFDMKKISDLIQIPAGKEEAFREFYDRSDKCLAGFMPKLASETIYQSILFNNFLHTSINLRYDFTRHNTVVWQNNLRKDAGEIIALAANYVKDDYLFVLLDPNR